MERKKTTRQLPDISGTLLVFGGVYSNLQALEALQQNAKELKIPSTNIICTGDIAGYCAQPEECFQLVENWGIAAIAGNVEIKLREEENNCGCNFSEGGRCNIFSKNWYAFAASKMTEQRKDWLLSLPDFLSFQFGLHKCFVLHGSQANTAEYIFKSSPWELKQHSFKAADADVILAGHSGLPFAQQQENKLWLNSGALGMPANDAGTHVWYALLWLNDKGELCYSFEKLDYDYKKAAALMLDNELPAAYAQTLQNGLWDNCEILPEEEAGKQGKEIVMD